MEKIIIYIFAMLFCIKASAQGCSDAGFCTAGSLKTININSDSIKNSLNFSLNYSQGERGTVIIVPQFEPTVKTSENSFVQIKIPYFYINGKLSNTKGLGDVLINYNYIFDSVVKYKFSLTGGVKIASGSASLKSDGICLPMPYQVSLGTTDFIGGFRIFLKQNFTISLGIQIPIFNINQNSFDSAAFKFFGKRDNLENSNNYFISSGLKRKSDLMMRIDKTFIFNKSSVSIGLLPIYHLGKDEVKTNNLNNVFDKKSKGLTLNINAGGNIKISNKLNTNIVAAMPLITRKSRPDGLTRKFIAMFSFNYEM